MGLVLLLLVFPGAIALAFALRSHFAPRSAEAYRCARCGYAREGLALKALCPECGQDPMQPPPLHRRLPRTAYLAFLPQAAAVPILLSILWRRDIAMAALLWPLSALIAAACVWIADGHTPRRNSWILLAAGLIGGWGVTGQAVFSLAGALAGRASPAHGGVGLDLKPISTDSAVAAGFLACAGFSLAALGVLLASSIRRHRPAR